MVACACERRHTAKRVVLTGGPGAGKTALLELIRQSFCVHVRVLPEAASIVFGGGFPRDDDDECRRGAQRAIFHVQRELEATGDSHRPAIVLCDRDTPDGLAYWPGSPDEYWNALDTTPEIALIHAGLGDTDVAFEWLARAVRDRSGWIAYLHADPRLDSLHGDPRFPACAPSTLPDPPVMGVLGSAG